MNTRSAVRAFLNFAAPLGCILTLCLAGCQRPHPGLPARERAAEQFGEEIAKRFPGKTAVVLGNPFLKIPATPAEAHEAEEAALRGLRKGVRGRLDLIEIAYPSLREGATEDPARWIRRPTTTPLSYLIRDDAIDRILAARTNCQLFVSLIGIPSNASRSDWWRREPPVPMALFLPDLRILGTAPQAIDAFRSGRVALALVDRPRRIAGPSQPAQSTDYLVLTADNVETELRTNPELLR